MESVKELHKKDRMALEECLDKAKAEANQAKEELFTLK